MADFRQDQYNQCSNYQILCCSSNRYPDCWHQPLMETACYAPYVCGDLMKGKTYSYETTKIISLCTSGNR